MKKISKIMVFVLMLVISVASFAISPALGVVMAAGTGLVGASITLTKMPTKGEVNKAVYLPKGSSDNGAEVTVKVTDPSGKDVSTVIVDNSNAVAGSQDNLHIGEYKFVPTMVGNYKVQYQAPQVTGYKATKSKIYTVKVSGTRATLGFDENTPFILPERIGAETSIVLPYPNISETGDQKDEVKGTYETVNVEIKDSKHNVMAEKTVTIDGAKYFVLTANKDAQEKTIYGNYSVTYSYFNTAGVKVAKAYSVNISENYTTENQNVTFTWEGSMPESGTLGEKVELPKPVTVDKNRNSEAVLTYTKVSVDYVENGEVKKSYDVDEQDFTFVPMNEAKNNNYYKVNYKIYTIEKLDLYNYFNGTPTKTLSEYLEEIETPTITRTYDLKNVTDNKKPTPVAVNAYTVTTDANEVKTVDTETIDTTDISYIIPSKARVGVEIELPAIYATDNFDAYGSLTLTRGITYKASETSTSDTTVYVETATNTEIKDSDDNALFTFEKKQANELSKITFHQAGTYKITYQARDASGNVNRDVVYKIVVPTDANYSDSVAPHITLAGLPNSVVNGSTISFDAPKVVDYEKDHNTNPTNVSTVDSNVKTDVYYYFGEYVEGKLPTDSGSVVIEKDKNDSTLYTFDVNATSQTKLTIVVRAEDDAKYTKNGLGLDGADSNNVTYEYKTISIYGLNDDTTAPKLADANSLEDLAEKLNDNGQSQNYGQGKDITIFDDVTVKYSDTNDSSVNKSGYLTTNLVVYDANGEEIDVKNFTYEYDGNYITLKGGEIVTTVAGEYSVVITTSDVAGNTLVNSVNFVVADTKAPALQVKGLNSTMELGTTYTLPTPIVVDDGRVIENKAKAVVEFVSTPGNYQFISDSLAFTPEVAGTYSFVYVANDGTNEMRSDVYSITVNDTKDPVIELHDSVPLQLPVGVKVYLPSYDVFDVNDLEIKTHSLTVKDPSGNIVNHVEGEDFAFIFEKDGKYSVEYLAVDKAGNDIKLPYTIAVGDAQDPTITLTDANKYINKEFKIGETITVDIEGVTVTDGDKTYDVEEEADKTDGKFQITLTKDGSDPIVLKSTNDYSHTFTEAGTYTLKYYAKDEAGNDKSPIIYTIEVKGNTNSSIVTEQTWGTILMIGSIVLLAGVVIYFVKTKDKTDSKEKSKELASKINKDEE